MHAISQEFSALGTLSPSAIDSDDAQRSGVLAGHRTAGLFLSIALKPRLDVGL